MTGRRKTVRKAKSRGKRAVRVAVRQSRLEPAESPPEKEDFTALYFPHLQIEDPELIRSSLLLWDTLHYITPDKRMRPFDRDTPSNLVKALEVIASPHVPRDEEKQAAHEIILKVVDNTPRDEWRKDVRAPDFDYAMYRGKLMRQTFDELEQRGLGVPWEYGLREFAMHSRLGLTVMAILAACCSGVSRQAVTDRIWDYVGIGRALPRLTRITHKPMTGHAQLIDRLMRASFEVIDLSNVRLERLVALRERDDREFNELRHGYVRVLRQFVREGSKHPSGTGAGNAIEAEFISKARKWVDDLEKVLEVENTKRRLLHMSAGASAVLAVKHVLTNPGEAALELLAAFASYRYIRFDVSSRAKVRRQSPVGYLHFLSKLR